jgi:dGTPase
VTDGELETAFDEFMDLPFWDFSFDGGPASLAAVKNLTSELVGRFCQAAEQATLAHAGEPRLSRYAADLEVPRRQLLECALLKAVSAHYVIFTESAVAPKARERELIAELAAAILAGAPETLDPVLRQSWLDSSCDAERRRVIVDQVASLTDTSAIAWQARLCGTDHRC